MAISIYNSLTRRKEEFLPLAPPLVRMYACGPTVYDQPHIGHARSAYIFDVIRRYLVYRGYEVKFVRNVTDVDDKIIEKARQEYPQEDLNSAFKRVADKYLASYHEALNNLNIAVNAPDIIEPRASDYINKMVDFIKVLIDRGVAYQAGRDVYFDISKAKNYGKLSNQSLEKMESGARVEPSENKRNPLDFALWKSVKDNEPSWESPWGKGRPGWHIECSVMSQDILGAEFDIHGGGMDLIFPHHENEIAQSEGAGNKFARVWVHHGLLTINAQKMAKSLGNFLTIQDFLGKYANADLLKLFFLSAHYSHPVDYTEEKIEETKKAYERITIFMQKLDRIYGSREKLSSSGAGDILQFKQKFIEYMDDDFNTPRALSVLFEMINRCNVELGRNDEMKVFKLNYALSITKDMAGIFGLRFFESALKDISGGEIEFIISLRSNLKNEGNFSESDKLREKLETKGIILEDNKDGTTSWRRKQ